MLIRSNLFMNILVLWRRHSTVKNMGHSTLDPATEQRPEPFARLEGKYPRHLKAFFLAAARRRQSADSDADIAVFWRGVRGDLL